MVVATRPRVYVFHGLLGTAYGHFGHQIRSWAEAFDVVPVDLPGHGRCRASATEDYADGVAAYAQAVVERFGPGHLVAASYLGGPAAVRVAETRPALVRSIVLTGFVPDLPADVFMGWTAAFEELPRRNPQLSDEYDRLHGPRWRETLRCFTADVAARYESRVKVTRDRLVMLDRPVLIANGSHKSAERTAAASADTIGGQVSGVVIPDAGHIAGYHNPDAYARAVESFWAEAVTR